MATILPEGMSAFFDNNGNPLSGGTIDFYTPNTTTRKDTYKDSDQTIVNSNPVVLDSAGRAIIYGTGSYRQVLKDSSGNLIFDVITSEAVVSSLSAGGTSTGTADAQIVSPGVFSFLDGQTIVFTAGFTNTGSMTIQVGSATPVALLKNSASGPVNLATNDIVAGNIYLIAYSLSNGNFQLLQSIPPVITIASQAEAEAGTNNTNMMTPLRTAQALTAQLPTAATAAGLATTTDLQNAQALIHVREEQSSGSGAGNAAITTYQTRVLNTIVTNTISGATLSSNAVTLPAGTYDACATAPLGLAGSSTETQITRIRLRDVTASATLILGPSSSGYGGSNAGAPTATLQGRFTLAAEHAVRIEQFVRVSGSSIAQLGDAISSGENEVYSELLIYQRA